MNSCCLGTKPRGSHRGTVIFQAELASGPLHWLFPLPGTPFPTAPSGSSKACPRRLEQAWHQQMLHKCWLIEANYPGSRETQKPLNSLGSPSLSLRFCHPLPKQKQKKIQKCRREEPALQGGRATTFPRPPAAQPCPARFAYDLAVILCLACAVTHRDVHTQGQGLV